MAKFEKGQATRVVAIVLTIAVWIIKTYGWHNIWYLVRFCTDVANLHEKLKHESAGDATEEFRGSTVGGE